MYTNIKVSNYKVSLPIKLEILSRGNPPEMPKVLFMFVRKDIVVQLLSRVQLFAASWTAACQASLSLTISSSLLKLISIESVTPSNHLFLNCPLLLPPSIYSSIRVFYSESALRISWPQYQSFSFSISPSSEYSGLICFRIEWFDLLAPKGLSTIFSSTTA